MEDAESRLKCFLHYGSENRLYIPNGNLKNSFEPDEVRSIEELLRDDDWAEKIVPVIKEVNQLQTSITPCALVYALAMVVRKARVNIEKKTTLKPKSFEIEIETKSESKAEGGSPGSSNEESDPVEVDVEAASVVDPSNAPEKKNYKPQKWDLIIRDAYKVARNLSENKAENLFLFTHYLREIAKTEGKKGFGKGWRETVSKWYEYQTPLDLVKSVTKIYPDAKWTHADVLKSLRLGNHENKAKDAAFIFALYNFKKANEKYGHCTDSTLQIVLKHLKLIDNLRHAKETEHALEYVTDQSITLDFVPSNLLDKHLIWLQLIPKMTPQELLSLIHRLSRLKMFKYPEIVSTVVSKLGEVNHLKSSQPDQDLARVLINPFEVFIVRKDYEEGPNLAVEFQYIQRRRQHEGGKDRHQDTVAVRQPDVGNVIRKPPPRKNEEIINCLNKIFKISISSYPATGKRFLIAVDAQACNASKRCLYERFVTIEEAALVVALSVISVEPVNDVGLVTFTKEPNFCREIPLSICKEEEVIRTSDTMDSLKTKIYKDDCVNGNVGELIRDATRKKAKYDIFIVLSDNLLEVGGAYEALETYKTEVHANAKVITCCFIGRHKKYKELMKPDMLLICGFDKHVGNIIRAYSQNSF